MILKILIKYMHRLISKKRYSQAYRSFLRLRKHKVLAARDLYYTSRLIELEEIVAHETSTNKLVELVKIPRNRRAVLASSIVMFGQQFCGFSCCIFARIEQAK